MSHNGAWCKLLSGVLVVVLGVLSTTPDLWLNLGSLTLTKGVVHGESASCLGDSTFLSQADRFLSHAAVRDKDAYVLLAEVYLWQGLLFQMEQAVQNSSRTLPYFIEHANMDQKKGHDVCALRRYEALIQVAPDSSLPWYYMGNTFASQQRYALAQAAYDEAITRNNFEGDVIRLGDVYIQKGEAFRTVQAIADAYRAYSAATARGGFSTPSKEAFAYQKQGEMLVWMGRYTEAAEPLQQAIRIMPDFYNAYSLLGVVAYQQGNIEEAIQQWEKAISIEPKYVWPYLHLARMYRDLGEYAKARTYYHQVLSLEPQNQTALKELVELEE